MIRFLFFFVFALSSFLTAQNKLVTVRAMSLGGGDFPETFLRTKAGYEPIRFSSVQPSAKVRAVATNSLPIFFSDPSDEEEEKVKPDALVKLPAVSGGILLLGWESNEKRNFVALEDNLGKGGADNWLLVNATTERIAFQIGKGTKPSVVEPGKSATHRVTAKMGEGAAVSAARIDGQSTKLIFSTYWTVFEAQRCVILFVPDGDDFIVRQIQDITSVEKMEE